MRVKGISCPDTRVIVKRALDSGEFTWGGVAKSGHGRLVHTASNTTLVFGLTPGVASWKTLATDIRRLSGLVVWRKGNRKPGRPKVLRADVLRMQREERDRERIIARRAAQASPRRRIEPAPASAVEKSIAEIDARFRELQSLMRPGRVVL